MNLLDLIGDLEREGLRLWEQDGEIRFRGPRGRMTEELRTALREHKQAVLECLRGREGATVLEPRPAARYDPFPLTEIQSAYLLGRRGAFAYGGVGCHGYGELLFSDLNPSRLSACWRTLIARHDMLRAVFQDDGSQRILAEVPEYRILVLDLRGAGPEAVEAQVARLRAEMDHRVYPPDSWPLFDLRITLKDEGALLHFSIDLLIADFLSTMLLLEELHDLYFEPDRLLEPLGLSFRDYLLAARALRESDRYRRDRDYWLGRLDSLPPAPELPVLIRPTGREIRFVRRQVSLDPRRWSNISSTAVRRGITASVALLAAYAETIGRWSRRAQFTLNLTLQNRLPLHAQADQVVGDFTSLELLAVDLDRGPSLLERARCLQSRLWEDLDHRLFSGSEVMRELGRRRRSDAILFPVVFTSSIGVKVRGGGPPRGLGDFVYGITQTPQVWIDCQALESRNGLVVNWDTRQDVFPDGVVTDMFRAFADLLERMAGDETAWDEPDPVTLPPGQVERRLRANATSSRLPDALLHEGVVARALCDPDRPAVITSERTLTFGDWVSRAVAVADELRSRGIAVHDRVAISLPKGPDQPVALLGTLMAGCVYVPLDVDQPHIRRSQLMTDAGVKAVLLHSSSLDDHGFPAGSLLIPVDLLPPAPLPRCLPHRFAEPDTPAYAIYTSGSTGQPKAVVVSHRSAVNTIEDVNRRFHVSRDDRILGLSSIGFDLSVYDVFGPPSLGGCLVLPDHGRRADPSHWVRLVERHRITLWNSVPAQMQMLYDYLVTSPDGGESPDSLRLAMLSGDWIPVELPGRIRERLPRLSLVSLGGATEAAIWSIFYPITEISSEWRSIPYGRPLTNQTFHVLDTALRACPEWVTGELYIGGVGLALGYHGDEEKTAERFLRHPATGERLYRTGDLGRWLPDGSIEFLGREDGQVKIRGHRIELAEVESVLRSHPSVGAATVLVDGTGPVDRRLVAFVETARRAPGERPAWDDERLSRSARSAVADLTRLAESDDYRQYTASLDEAALRSMLFALLEQGLFAEGTHSLEELLSTVQPRLVRVVRRWLRALRENRLLRYDPDTGRYGSEDRVELASLEEAWRRSEQLAGPMGEATLTRHLRSSAMSLAGLLRSKEDPRHVLLSGHGLDLVRATYREALPARWARRVASAILCRIASARAGRLRVLEIGGAAPLIVDEATALERENIEFLVADPSPLLLQEMESDLGDRPSVRLGEFDLNGHDRRHGLMSNRFDVVIALNILHRARDIDAALQQARELLAPCGYLIVSEVTQDNYAIMASLELLMDLDEERADFQDERQGLDETFLSPGRWKQAIARAGGENILCVPDPAQETGPSGMQVFVARFKQDRVPVDPDELTSHLAERLPDYMVPSQVHVLDALPLTTNAKIDHKQLRSWLSREEAAPISTRTSEAASDLEQRLIAVWASVLDVQDICRDQGLLELGGDSLIAARLAGRLREGVPEARSIFFDELLRELLDGTTVARLACLLTSRRDDKAPEPRRSAVALLKVGGADEPVRVLVHDGDGHLAQDACTREALAAHGTLLGLIVGDTEAYLGLPSDSLIERTAEACVAALIDGCCLSVQLIGSGAASALAVEIARQLTEAGAIVEHLTLIGGSPPDHFVQARLSDPGVGEIYRHLIQGLRSFKLLEYAGDITVLWMPDGPVQRDDAVAYWRRVCLGELQMIDTADDTDAIVKALLGPACSTQPGC